jgi:hypothetical protein
MTLNKIPQTNTADKSKNRNMPNPQNDVNVGSQTPSIVLPAFCSPPLRNGGYTMFALVRFKTTPALWGRVFQAYMVGSPKDDFATLHKHSNSMRAQLRWDGSGYIQEANDFANDVWYVYAFRTNGAAYELLRDNIVVASGTGGYTLHDASMHFGVAANIFNAAPSAAGCNFGNIDLAALIMYDRFIDNNDMLNVYNYLTSGFAQ